MKIILFKSDIVWRNIVIVVRELRSIGELIDFSFMEGVRNPNFPKRTYYTFRGQNQENFQLISSLKRNSGSRTDYAEKRLLNNFCKYGELLEPKICKSIWHTMVMAQHHGVPTRCLDFFNFAISGLTFCVDKQYKR